MHILDRPVGTKVLIYFLLAAAGAGAQTPARRIVEQIDSARPAVLAQSPNIHLAGARAMGPLDGQTRIPYMRLVVRMTPAQSADLTQLLEAQRDPSSPDYHRWLTPEEFGARFGADPQDLATVAQWLREAGFTVEQTARASNWIAFSGAAAQVEKTFRTPMGRYEWQGETHFANAAAPSIPAALADFVEEIRGLDDFRMKAPPSPPVNANWTAGGSHYLAPDDLAAIYDIAPLYTAGYDGSGQKIAIVGQTDINLADIRAFRSQFGLAAKDPQLVLYGADPGTSVGDQVESSLDLEWAGAVARNATTLFVYSRDVMESVAYAIDQNLAPVISMSYGSCELGGVSTAERTLAQQANAEGITWINSSGDSGAAGCDWGGPSAAQYGPAVTYPADIPEVTAVGGTEFNESGTTGWSATNSSTYQSATGYLPEKAWNDTALGGGIWASGGGVSTVFPKPSWQSGPGVPADNARDVPDVSLTASGDHDGYVIFYSGQLYSVGGTSASSPSFAGIVTLLNHYLTAKGIESKAGLGNINPSLYSMAQNVAGAIHDITAGDNIVPCAPSSTGCSTGSFGYKAGVGYDMATGLGSVDAYNLVTKWPSAPVLVGTTMKLAANPASIAASATTQLTATVSAASGTTAPAGSVTFTAAGASLGSATLSGSGSSATATLTVKGSSLAGGANSISATYVGAGSCGASNASVSVTVTNAPVATNVSMTASPSTVASTGTVSLNAVVAAASGNVIPSGTLTFLLGSTTLGTATLSPQGSGSLTLAASKLAVGANSIKASYAGGTSFAASVSPAITVTVTTAAATTTTLTATPTSLPSSASVALTATVKAASGSATPTGTVTFLDGANSLGSSTLSAAGTASLTLAGSKLSAGANSLTASYAGSTAFAASVSTAVSVAITAATTTTTTVTAAPSSIAPGASTVLTVTVTAASGSTTPTGSVTFTVAGASANAPALGTATLSGSGATATASMTVKGTALAPGANTITAIYAGDSKMASSSGQVTVTVAAAAIATTSSVTASPASIASTASTTLTATVKAASGSAAPMGAVTFTAGSATLGTATLSSTGAAALTVAGTKLATGANAITASYGGATGFAASSGTVSVTVTAPAAATATTLSANPASITATASTTVTATVKASSGSAAPAGTVTFSVGTTALGSATLTGSGSSATATLSVKGSSLAAGANTIVASYAGATGFAPSSGTVAVSITGASGSNVTATASKGTTAANLSGFPVALQLHETAGVATTVTDLTINGTDFASALNAMFGSTKLAANGTLTANIVIQWSPLPNPLTFVFTGADASGKTWTQTATLATK